MKYVVVWDVVVNGSYSHGEIRHFDSLEEAEAVKNDLEKKKEQFTNVMLLKSIND